MLDKNVREVTVDVKLEESDFVKYNLPKVLLRPSVFLMGLMALGGSFFTFLVIYSAIFQGFRPSIPIYILIALNLYCIYYPYKLYRLTVRAYRDNKFAQELTHYVISDKGISASSDTGNSNFGWDMLYKAKETRKLILLGLTGNSAYYIPKRFFKNQNEIEIVRDILITNLSPKQFKK